MARREYVNRFPCAEPGCTERSYHVADTQREQAQTYKDQQRRPWRCYRHTKPQEVLSAENAERRAELVCGPRGSESKGLYWHGESALSSGSGIAHGTGFKAIADDFPPGTRLIVTARIELPADEEVQS